MQFFERMLPGLAAIAVLAVFQTLPGGLDPQAPEFESAPPVFKQRDKISAWGRMRFSGWHAWRRMPIPPHDRPNRIFTTTA